MAKTKAATKTKAEKENEELHWQVTELKMSLEAARRHFAEQEKRNAELTAFNNDLKARQEVLIDMVTTTAAVSNGECVLVNLRRQAAETLRRISMMSLRSTK